MEKIDLYDLKCHLDRLFKNAIEEKAFSAVALGFSFIKDIEIKRKILFYGSSGKKEIYVDNQTFFDLASLTKPLVTVLSLLSLIEERKIFFDSLLQSLFSFKIPEDKKNIRLFHLMSHCSGLPSYRPYFKNLMKFPLELRRREVITNILEEELENLPGMKSVYSDLGYILLGYIVEEISGERLNEYWKKKIAIPLSLEKKILFPTKEDRCASTYASTRNFFNEEEDIYLDVHDDNCRVLGGVAGHAGLFGTVEGVLSLCENLLLEWHDRSKHPSYSNELLRKVFKKEKRVGWTLGFDTPSVQNSSSGIYFSKNSVGHLGFTGTSFWIDIEKNIVIVLLTNRVCWGIDNVKIKTIRPLVHDMIMKELLKM